MPSNARNLANLLGAGESTISAEKLGSDVAPGTEDYSSIDSLGAGTIVGETAFVEGSNRLYIWNGSGWYNIALINTTPTWDSGGEPSSSYVLDADSPQDATVITLAASDPEGLPISYNYITSGQMDSIATISQDSSVFTITPKTEAQAPDGGTGSITFRASDGVNILPYVSSFTLTFSIDWTTVTEEASLNTSGAGSEFGFNVGIDESGSSIVASSYETPKGAAYVFTRSGTTWSQDAKLVPNNYSTDAGVGSGDSVCISKDGTYVVLGGIYDSTNVTYGGGAHVFVYASGSWSEQARLDASDAGSLFMPRFGSSVAIDGDNNTIATFARSFN